MIRFALRLVRPYWKWLLIVAGRDAGRDGDGAGVAVAAQDRARLGVRRAADAAGLRMARGRGRRSAGAAERRRRGDGRDRAAAGGERLPERVLHRQHRPVDRARPAPERLRPPAAAVDVVLRPAAGRAAHQHDHRRHQRRPGLRVDVAARHPDRQPDHRRHAGGDVLAELALHARRAGGDAAARRSSSIRLRSVVKAGDARRAPPAERDRVDRPGGARRRSASSRRSRRARSSGSGWTRRASRASRRRSTRGACARCSGRW